MKLVDVWRLFMMAAALLMHAWLWYGMEWLHRAAPPLVLLAILVVPHMFSGGALRLATRLQAYRRRGPQQGADQPHGAACRS